MNELFSWAPSWFFKKSDTTFRPELVKSLHLMCYAHCMQCIICIPGQYESTHVSKLLKIQTNTVANPTEDTDTEQILFPKRGRWVTSSLYFMQCILCIIWSMIIQYVFGWGVCVLMPLHMCICALYKGLASHIMLSKCTSVPCSPSSEILSCDTEIEIQVYYDLF